ncbi:endonuclease domain-containing protein [Pelagibius marinus]|uniref:endonuclease domain-containing protein n=1 Tax=Pelagibius marinus TaxID=2762760 RepID=UPI0018721BAD|nr:endonuclease domain-containing protein [Pelagibius marinus]
MALKNARQLRGNMTEAEQRLWSALRRRQLDGLRFRRQVPLGRFIVDFACYEARVVVELDGGQHAESEAEDAMRTRWLEDRGFRVLRFWNDEVFGNLEGLLEAIRAAAAARREASDVQRN